jgi:hypothetical protein
MKLPDPDAFTDSFRARCASLPPLLPPQTLSLPRSTYQMSHSEWLAILDDKHPVVGLAHSLCLPPGELKEKVSLMVAERFQMHSHLKTEAQKMLNSYLAASALWRVEMGAGNWSAQNQTLRLSWVKLLDYFFNPKTASFAALATRNLRTVLANQ